MNDLAFFVACALPDRSLGTDELHVARNPRPTGLVWEPESHLYWQSDDSRVVVGAWQPVAAEPEGTRWHTSEEGVALSVGMLRFRGRPWASQGDWAAQLWAAVKDEPLRDVATRLEGAFAAAVIDRYGRGTIILDPVAFRCIYYAQTANAMVVSSRAELVARALAGPHGRMQRDTSRTAWLAYNRYGLGQRSGFARVNLVPPRCVVELRPGEAPQLEPAVVARADADTRQLDRDQLIEAVRAQIAEGLRAALTLPADDHAFGLTGGKDSRLLLAVALSEGLTDGFTFYTWGPPDNADVVVASQLAAQFGLRHQNGFTIGRIPDGYHALSYGDRIRQFVAQTAGMSNIWDVDPPLIESSKVWVNGQVGEFLRTFVNISPRIAAAEDVVREFEATKFSRLDLLTADATREFRSEALAELRRTDDCGLDPRDRLHDFYLHNRVRLARHGALEELGARQRIEPLYSPAILRAGFAIGAEARRAELLHFEITRRCSEDLARAPFARRATWSDRLLGQAVNAEDYITAPDNDVTPPRNHAATAVAPAQPQSEILREQVQRMQFGEREKTFREILADTSNPAWETIDRLRVLDAIDRHDVLKLPERIEVQGAITTALWLEQKS